MTNEEEIITATLSLTKNQWEVIINYIMNGVGMLEVQLCRQTKKTTDRIKSDAIELSEKINEATGVNIDLSKWVFYEEKK